MALAGPLPNNTLLANWFVRRRGTAFGISQFGITISGTAMVPLTTWLVLEFGWRSTVALFAIAPLAVLAPLIWWLVVDRPEARGLSPDGDTPAAPSSDAYAYKPLKMGAALRDRRIWLLTLTVGPSFMTIGAVIQAMHSHITDMGMSGMQASSVLVLMTFMGAVAKPLFGILADHSNPRAAMALSLALQGTGLGLIVQLQSHGGLMLAGFLFGLGYGGVMPLWSVLLGALFGRESFARAMGLMGPLTLPFTLVGLPFTTFVFERTGSYRPAFIGLLAFLSVSVVALAALRVPRR
jgi:cyanate permease